MNSDDVPDILSGDGNSPETAIRFTPCHIRERVKAEFVFVCARHGRPHLDWTEDAHYTSAARQSVWVVTLKDGSRRTVYFETEGTTYDKDE